jgi:two-component system nitrogen regulation sensor histidine kinase NtrY
MSNYLNKLSGLILLSVFFILFILTIYSLISSNEIIRDAELIQYIFIADIVFFLILLLYLALFLINYIKSKKRDIIGLRLFNKFFLFFGIFSIIPSGLILLSSAIFFNIELSTWLGPAFKSSVNNSYQLAQRYIDQTERDLIVDSKFIRNYVLAERLIDRDIIERFDIATVYNVINDNPFIEYFTKETSYELSADNFKRVSEITEDDITIYFYDQQLFSKINLYEDRYLILLKTIDLETLNYYQNIINSYNAINSIDSDKKNIQITFFTIYTVLSVSLIIIFIIIGTNFSFRLAKPIRSLNSAIISLKKGNIEHQNIEKSNDKDDISQLTNSFYDMSKTISAQRINLEETNNTISDQLQFINNIIKNSPYGIFVIHNKELIFQNDASNIFKENEKSSFLFLKEKIINGLKNKNQNFDSFV